MSEGKELKKAKKRNRILINGLVICTILAFLGGWIFGSFEKFPYFDSIRQASMSKPLDSDAKIDSVRTLLEKYWYFGKDIEDLDTRLTDQALYGMSDNEEDPHTSYMSAQEIESFTQSINRNFVGIGVTYIATEDGQHMVTNVFPNSPAEKAGVQAGDLIHAVNDTVVDGMANNDIAALVRGEEGTVVTMVFVRDGRNVTLDITRAEVANTVNGKVREDGIGYLSIAQFGQSTAEELRGYLDRFKEAGVSKLIIDVRGDGGGYLDALKGVVSCFLKENTVFLTREYADGRVESMSTGKGLYPEFEGIVILVNENTASAAEAFTLAMSEQREDVTVIGTTTYGKGTVQVSQYFEDGSALKFTDSRWMSPSGVWINGKGITPDQIVELHPIMYRTYRLLEEGHSFTVDQVSEDIETAELCLDYLGYAPERIDGYFSEQVRTCIEAFQKDRGLEVNGLLDAETDSRLITAVMADWAVNESKDTQLLRALGVLHE